MTARHFLPEDLLPLKLLGRIHGSKGKPLPATMPDPARGANVLFCDGHVEWHTQKELITLRINGQPSAMAPRWNNDNKP